MKYNKFILPLAACAFLFAGCVDEVMEWQEPDGTITEDDIPLQDNEALGLYKSIKEYAAEYTPDMKIGLGLGADLYIEDAAYKELADANFQMFTTGNAMKHSSVVKANGDLNFATIDAFMALVPSDIEVYGHNFLWHTQQKQQYLKSLIAPEMKVEVPQGEKCENVVTNGSFDNGTDGWSGFWGKYTYDFDAVGQDGTGKSIHITTTTETSVNHDSQLWWGLTEMLQEGTYYYEFQAKSNCNLEVQFLGQNDSYAGLYREIFTAGSDWTLCFGEFTYSGDPADIARVGIQFGGTPGAQIWIDDFKFGKKLEESEEVEQDPMINIVGEAGTFESGDVSAFGCWGNNSPTKEISAENEGHDSKYSMKLINPEEGGEYQEWKAQAAYDLAEYLSSTKTYVVSFWVKSDVPGTVQFQFQNGTTYASQGGYARFNTTSEWLYCEHVFQTVNGDEVYDDVNRILINFGAFAATYYIDDFKFGEENPAATASMKAPVKLAAPTITYVYKTAEEKKALLLGAMESWIKQMAEHLPTVKHWDVINEPIMDGSNAWRGIDNVFNGEDTAPVENEGLTLNWASDHWYWGYYIGKEYASKAFEYARQYCGPDAKLFVNDYNLETSPGKLKALIDFAKYIDENNSTGAPLVDGIGTQMHVQTSITKEKVDDMFKTMAATGKLVRVTELDVAVGTSNPTAEELLKQAEIYKMIVESYKENVPAEQQSGITIWTLSDNAAEHEFWLNGDAPNLFDGDYQRKLAYKYICDAIAGKDLSEDFKGSDWKDLIEIEETEDEEAEEGAEETPAE